MKIRGGERLTVTTESRAAMATISAQETTPGHTASTFVLIWSITSKPLTELLLGPAVFSPVKEEVSSRSIDPSQPYQLYIFVQFIYRILVNSVLSYVFLFYYYNSFSPFFLFFYMWNVY